ncbi:taste receptor type 2 member 8-like [Erinaceus europaeus]|uniref:Taste receptor type 2 member 8-like n=1 Tax=Erinaceus europaeus TaxID=9365 RepID=A0A1S3W2I3_ERIEU|nr:taste receptor type 2 member 8-like [Erinaceus europaeus]
MSTSAKTVFVTIEILESVAGVWGNGFIVVVLCADWIKTKKITLFDFIYTCLAISRIVMIYLLLEDSIALAFNPELIAKHPKLIVIADFFWNLNSSLSSWCATGLGVFYFLKLSQFAHPFFLWLKWRRDQIVLAILLGFFLSLLSHLLSIKFYILWINQYEREGRNLSWRGWAHKSQYFSKQVLLNGGSLMAFPMSFISFFLLIISLGRHTRQIMHHAKGLRGFNTEVHVRARNTMISFIIFLVVHYTSTLLIIWTYNEVEDFFVVVITETIALLYFSVHPYSMILGNGKLRQTFVNLIKRTECFSVAQRLVYHESLTSFASHLVPGKMKILLMRADHICIFVHNDLLGKWKCCQYAFSDVKVECGKSQLFSDLIPLEEFLLEINLTT